MSPFFKKLFLLIKKLFKLLKIIFTVFFKFIILIFRIIIYIIPKFIFILTIIGNFSTLISSYISLNLFLTISKTENILQLGPAIFFSISNMNLFFFTIISKIITSHNPKELFFNIGDAIIQLLYNLSIVIIDIIKLLVN